MVKTPFSKLALASSTITFPGRLTDLSASPYFRSFLRYLTSSISIFSSNLALIVKLLSESSIFISSLLTPGRSVLTVIVSPDSIRSILSLEGLFYHILRFYFLNLLAFL